MRRKNSKILKIFVFFCVFILSNIHYTYAISSHDISDNTLIIKVDKEGDFTEMFNNNEFNGKFENIIIKGKMSCYDIVTLEFISEKCKSIDLTNVNTELIISEGFMDFYNLEDFKFPKNLTYVSGDTLSNCPNLKSVALPENLQYIEYHAFRNCPNLKMTVPANVKLAEDVFYGSPGVKILKNKSILNSLYSKFVNFIKVL